MVVKQPRATIDDLYREPGKAELIGGRIVRHMPTGRKPGRVAARILRSLADHADRTGVGEAFGDAVGYVIPELPSGRESISPDASYYDGPEQEDPMRFIAGPPTFAAEVRSECDYFAGADVDMAEKRVDYFAAGTRVVWEVDTVNEVIYVYRPDKPEQPTAYRHGDTAQAEPAVPGWRVAVDWIFA